MSDMSGKFEVGYAKPPVEHRFKKGQSGNAKGRPRGAKAKPKVINTGFGMQGAEEYLRLEAYRPVRIREGEDVIELPAIQAVFRAMGVSAMKGNRLAQKTLAELVGTMERDHYQLRMEAFGTAVEYKHKWDEEIERCRKAGLPSPRPFPTPTISSWTSKRVAWRTRDLKPKSKKHGLTKRSSGAPRHRKRCSFSRQNIAVLETRKRKPSCCESGILSNGCSTSSTTFCQAA